MLSLLMRVDRFLGMKATDIEQSTDPLQIPVAPGAYPASTGTGDYIDRVASNLRGFNYFDLPPQNSRDYLPDRRFLDLVALCDIRVPGEDPGGRNGALSKITFSDGHDEPVFAFVPVGGCAHFILNKRPWFDVDFEDLFQKLFEFYFSGYLTDAVGCVHIDARDTNDGHRCFYYKISIRPRIRIILRVTKFIHGDGSVAWTLANYATGGTTDGIVSWTLADLTIGRFTLKPGHTHN
jgi:hypothetical protein